MYLADRCRKLGPIWKALSRSPACMALKLQALDIKCWPMALHGANGCPISNAIMNGLRTSAARALGFYRAAVSTILRLSISASPEADPGFYQACEFCWISAGRAPSNPTCGVLHQGPFSKLLEIFSSLGWHATTKLEISDQERVPHDLLRMPANLLRRVIGFLKLLAKMYTVHPSRD